VSSSTFQPPTPSAHTAPAIRTGHPDVVVIGGGVIGLSIAYVLSHEGRSVTLLDRREVGREASWAGAGILAPTSEVAHPLPIARLRALSAARYPEWSAALLAETGIDNGYRRSGSIDVAFDAKEAHELQAAAGRWKLEGIAFERLEPHAFGRVEPALSLEPLVGYFLPDRAQIRNPRHLQALAVACENRGARLETGRPATGFAARGERVEAVETRDAPIPCGAVVVAAGAWSEGILATLGEDVPTPPVKGQIVLLNPGRVVLKRIVEHGSRYLVPRDDGRVLVGSTEEDAGFDTTPTAAACRDLIDEALRLCPTLADAPVERTWAGLRPGSFDTRPYLGALPGFDNLIVATGHRRAGLQLSPATAEVVADLIAGRPPSVPLDDFQPLRPAASEPDAFRS